MTIDERLDRLTERHEALTQTAELLTRDLQSIRDFSRDMSTDVKEAFLVNETAVTE